MPVNPNEAPVHCSFCGASQSDAGVMIVADGGVSICAECVNVCAGLVMSQFETFGKPATANFPCDDMGTPV